MAAAHQMPRFRKLFFVLLGLGALLGIYYAMAQHVAQSRSAPPVPDASVYRADAPPGVMPQHVLEGLVLLRPEQVLKAPLVDGFQWPCGSPSGAMMYDAQPFGAMNAKRHGHHTGQDLNGIGGQNSDLGVAVNAAARGLVVYSGEPSPEWGNVVVLAHRVPGQEGVVQTLYAHLQECHVRVGQLVSRGQPIGSMGSAGGRYWAHLHFEAIPSWCIEAGMPGYHPGGTMNRMDPAELIRRFPAPAFSDAYEQVRRLRIREAASEQTRPAPSSSSSPSSTTTYSL